MSRPSLSTSRAVVIFKGSLECRREYCADIEFFKMPAFLEWLCGDEADWSVKTFSLAPDEQVKRKASVIALDHRVKIRVSEKLMEDARGGCSFSNFILAHEIGHLIADHHFNSAANMNFQLSPGRNGMSNIPPTLRELEANFAAVFLQCGSALLDHRLNAVDLALRAHSDVNSVRKAQRIVRLDVFQKELHRLKPARERAVM